MAKGKSSKGKYFVPAIGRAIAILDTLAQERNGLNMIQISKKLKIPFSSTSSLLYTLERIGFIQKEELTGKYRLGLKLLGLGSIVLNDLKLRDEALPLLKELVDKIGVTAHLAVLDKGEAVYIEKVESDSFVRLSSYIGRRMPVHCTGVGKALLAYLPEVELKQIISERGLARRTPYTITSIRKLKEELERTRRRGYSLDDEEDELGIRCIGAPIFNHEGNVIASISIAGTVMQIPKDKITQLGQVVKETAQRISARLGYKLF